MVVERDFHLAHCKVFDLVDSWVSYLDNGLVDKKEGATAGLRVVLMVVMWDELLVSCLAYPQVVLKVGGLEYEMGLS